MDLSFLLLAIGLLCGFWDALFGRRLWPGDTDTLSQCVRFAWAERRWTVVGSLLVLVSVVLQAFGL